ncbi:MAG: CinA family protein [Lachnospiraceae bacterium]|nr:CinA family protein [Lachnospiraceae bacterium]
MYKDLIKNLIETKTTISTAESITGGLIAKYITDVPGSSGILKESFIVYSNDSKINVLGVDAGLISKYGVVSREVAYDMCVKLKMLTNDDICISTTGNAGPTVCDDKPVGRVYVGINYLDDIKVYECNFKGDRNKIREDTAEFVFDEISKFKNFE